MHKMTLRYLFNVLNTSAFRWKFLMLRLFIPINFTIIRLYNLKCDT